ncbi:MAG: haloacid dehalogenase-like hydrolase [Nanoarchaeota archaeon]|nr:haloacid dehalogenase-like hydrolase [Nanoarchaeota archaeon]
MKERVVFIDIDDTIVNGAIAEGIGIAALRQTRGSVKACATLKALQVKSGAYLFGETWALRVLVKSLKKAGFTKSDIEKFSESYIDRKIKPGAEKFLRDVSENSDLVILTTGFNTGLEMLEKKYSLNLVGKISNELVYNGNNEIVSSNILYNDKNIVRRVSEIASDYDTGVVIDDRPGRYFEINGHNDMLVYKSIVDFKKNQ